MPYRMTPSVRHRAIEVHYYYIITQSFIANSVQVHGFYFAGVGFYLAGVCGRYRTSVSSYLADVYNKYLIENSVYMTVSLVPNPYCLHAWHYYRLSMTSVALWTITMLLSLFSLTWRKHSLWSTIRSCLLH